MCAHAFPVYYARRGVHDVFIDGTLSDLYAYYIIIVVVVVVVIIIIILCVLRVQY